MKCKYIIIALLVLSGCVSTQHQTLKENSNMYGEFHKWNDIKKYDTAVLVKFEGMSVESINKEINKIKYSTDKITYGSSDYWASPGELFERNRGDCEDYAIAKYKTLEYLGVDMSNTYVAVVIKNDGAGHAVLIHDDMVLDNETNKIKSLTERKKDFKIMYMINNKTVWTI